MLACYKCTLDMHGKPQSVTWTRLASTAAVGQRDLVLQEAVDWVVGDSIIVAPTDWDRLHYEELTVEAVSADRKTVTVVTNLTYEHLGVSATFVPGQRSAEMRAEVGLLSHNIVFQVFVVVVV